MDFYVLPNESGIWFDATNLIRACVRVNTSKIEFDPVSNIFASERLGNPFKGVDESEDYVINPIMKDIVLKELRERKSFQLSIPKNALSEKADMVMNDCCMNSRRRTEPIPELLALRSVREQVWSSTTDSMYFKEDFDFKPAVVFPPCIEKPVLMKAPWSEPSVLEQAPFIPLQPKLLGTSVYSLKDLCLESYQTWFVRMNRTGLRRRFRSRHIHPIIHADLRTLHLPPVSLKSFLGMSMCRRFASGIIESLLDVMGIRFYGELSSYSAPEIRFEPIPFCFGDEEMIWTSVNDIQSPYTGNLATPNSQSFVDGIDVGNQFNNWAALFNGTREIRNVENNGVFEDVCSEDDNAPQMSEPSQPGETEQQGNHVPMDIVHHDDEPGCGVESVKPDTPIEKYASQESSHTIDLAVQAEQNGARVRDESWSPTDDLFLAHMEQLDREINNTN